MIVYNAYWKSILVILLSTIGVASSAQCVVTGRLTNEHGEAVEYASIGFEGDTVGVLSDLSGHFKLTIPAGRMDDLVFSHVSYLPATVPYSIYSSGKELNLAMRNKLVELAPIVVSNKRKARTLTGKSLISFSDCGFRGSNIDFLEFGPVFQNKKGYEVCDIRLLVKKCTYEQCTLSFNIYEVRGDKFFNILNKPIYRKVTPSDNGKLLHVSPEEIIMLQGKKRYCICLCVVDNKGRGEISFPITFKSCYARNNVKGKRRRLPAGPAIIVKGYEVLGEN